MLPLRGKKCEQSVGGALDGGKSCATTSINLDNARVESVEARLPVVLIATNDSSKNAASGDVAIWKHPIFTRIIQRFFGSSSGNTKIGRAANIRKPDIIWLQSGDTDKNGTTRKLTIFPQNLTAKKLICCIYGRCVTGQG